VIFSEFFELSM